jgi:uncharacterized protein (TIGR04222 family)
LHFDGQYHYHVLAFFAIEAEMILVRITMKRILFWLVIVLSVTWGSVQSAEAQKKGYFISDYFVVMNVEPNGNLRVIETINYVFTKGTFSYAYREIPIKGFQDLEFISVQCSETPVKVTQASLEGRWSKTFKLRWEFPNTTEPRSFRIEYVAKGAVATENDKNVVDWNPIGDKVDASISKVVAEVRLPREFSTGIETDPLADVQPLDGRTFITFRHRNLPRRTRYHIIARFPKIVETAAVPKEDLAAKTLVVVLPGTGIIVLFCVWLWFRVGRVQPTGGVVEVSSYPDPTLSLGEAAGLVYYHSGNSKAAIPAILFDMARQGVIRFDGITKQKWWGDSVDVRVTVLDRSGGQSAWQEKIIATLEEESDLKKLSRQSRFLSGIVRDIEQRLGERGLVSSDRERLRQRWIAGGIALLIVAIIFFILVLLNVWKVLLAVSILGVVAGVGVLIVGLSINTLSQHGADLKQALKSYGRWLKKEIDRMVEIDPTRAVDLFVSNLPALVFDSKVNRTWVQRLKKRVKRESISFSLPQWLELRNEQGERLDLTVAAGECFGLFTESVAYVAAYTGGGYGAASGGGAGAAGSGGGGGGAGAG